MVQQMCSASTHMVRLFPHPAAPSKRLLGMLTAEGSFGAVQALRFRVSDKGKKLDAKYYKPVYGHLFASCSQRADAPSNKSSFLVKAGSSIPIESDHESTGPYSIWECVKHSVDAFCRFSRPYALLGRIISVLSISLLAMDKLSDFSPLYFKGVLKVMVVTILMSIYIGGLNQLTDIEIDKINKPYLPLASGEYSFRTGSLIVAFCALAGFGIGWSEGSWPLFWTIFGKLLLGTAYSVNLPLLRWKRYPFLAALCIVVVWGVLQPVSYYLHFQTHLLQKPYILSKSLIITTTILSSLAIIMSFVKDIPDIKGDEKFGIKSLAANLGQERVFWICVTLLEMVYGAAVVVGAMAPSPWSKLILILGHSIIAILLWNRAKTTDIKNPIATQAFYMFIWKLHFAEYFLIPFIRF